MIFKSSEFCESEMVPAVGLTLLLLAMDILLKLKAQSSD